MDETRITRQLLYGELSHGHCQRGCQQQHYQYLIKTNMQHVNIHPKKLDAATSDRVSWHALTKTACKFFEECCCQCLREKREKGMCSAAEAVSVLTADFPHPRCPWVRASQKGLQSHLWAHKRKDPHWLHIIIIVRFNGIPRRIMFFAQDKY